jgi:hypothetical protein
LLAHEAGHIAEGHGGSGVLADEVAADRFAMDTLQRVWDRIRNGAQDTEPLDTAIAAGPPLVLAYEESRSRASDLPNLEDRGLHERYTCVLGRLPAGRRQTVERLLNPEKRDGSFGRVRIDAGEPVDAIWVDGVEYPPNEVLGAPLLVTSGTHSILGRAGTRLALADVRVSDAGQTVARLQFRETGAHLGRAELEELQKHARWFDVLIGTGGITGEPGAGEALFRFKALHRLGLGRLIPAAPAMLASDKEIRMVAGWRESAESLHGWR